MMRSDLSALPLSSKSYASLLGSNPAESLDCLRANQWLLVQQRGFKYKHRTFILKGTQRNGRTGAYGRVLILLQHPGQSGQFISIDILFTTEGNVFNIARSNTIARLQQPYLRYDALLGFIPCQPVKDDTVLVADKVRRGFGVLTSRHSSRSGVRPVLGTCRRVQRHCWRLRK